MLGKFRTYILRYIRRNRKLLVLAGGGFLVLFLLLGFFFLRPVMVLSDDARELKSQVTEVRKAVNKRKYDKLVREIGVAEDLFKQAEGDFRRLSYLKMLPWFRNYYKDGEHIFKAAEHSFIVADGVLEAIKPFKEVFGFDVVNIEQTTAEGKMAQIVQLSPHLVPTLRVTAKEIDQIRQEVNQIDPDRYPEEVQGFRVRSLLRRTKDQLNRAERLLEQAGPVLNAIPEALGAGETKTYLVLFQNDKEIRPTGGFITAYALLRFDRGNFDIIESDNIYEIDPQRAILPAPQPILNYLKVPSWHMRDTNFSPDFMVSMKDFETYYKQTNLPSVNGIVALDTHFLQELMKITGPVEIQGYDLDFSGQTNLPKSCQKGGTKFTSENVVCRLELYTQRILLGSDDRKDILGQMMNRIVDRVLVSEASQWLDYLTVLRGEATDKHILFYLKPSALQNLAESYNWAGRIRQVSEGKDYLHVNDANLAGLKADMYLQREVKQQIQVAQDGTIKKEVSLTYTNPKPQDGWLNAVARNYVRLYVPRDSKLIEVRGGDVQTTVSEDLDKTVFDNFLQIAPLSSNSVTFVYELPFKFSKGGFELLIQKQPGKDTVAHTIEFRGKVKEFKLSEDMVFQLTGSGEIQTQKQGSQIVY